MIAICTLLWFVSFAAEAGPPVGFRTGGSNIMKKKRAKANYANKGRRCDRLPLRSFAAALRSCSSKKGERGSGLDDKKMTNRIAKRWIGQRRSKIARKCL